MALKLFFKFSILYAVSTLVLVALVRDNPVYIMVGAYMETREMIPIFALIGFFTLLFGCVLMLSVGASRIGAGINARLRGVAFAFMGMVLFHGAFTIVKTTIPFVVPFFADPFFADFDKWLHGGVDPWVVVYRWDEFLPIGPLVPTYLTIWSAPALGFPLMLAVLDSDQGRILRYMILYVFAWVVMGNLVAAMGSSVGPVFYDRIYGGDRFADLQAALAQGGVAGTKIAEVQEGLWRLYDEHAQAFGSGISAFPSVHISTTMVVCMYLMERSKWFVPVAAAFLVHILVLSVYTGYHYAIDGYASILVMLAVWALVRRRFNRSGAAVKTPAEAAPVPSAA